MQPFDLAWNLLKGTLEEDMEVAGQLGPEASLQDAMSAPEISTEPYLQEMLNRRATAQGIHEANIGEPDYNWEQHLLPNASGVQGAVNEQEMEREKTEPWRYPDYQEPEGEDYRRGPGGLSEYDMANRPLPE